MKTPTVRNPYTKAKQTKIKFPKRGRTQQSFKDECNINNIIGRYNETGEEPLFNRTPPKYMDVSGEDMDFTKRQYTIAAAKTLYEMLPEATRAAHTLDELLNPTPDQLDQQKLSLGLTEAPEAEKPITSQTSEQSEAISQKESDEPLTTDAVQ